MNEDQVPYLQLVTTIREKCRRCYTCVRECPAKAIQILDGQASVIQTRCIGCGNCVTVCSQNAKQVLSGIEDTEKLFAGPASVAAVVAPSYPAEFSECETSTLVAALRELGFTYVHEVGAEGDLVHVREAEGAQAGDQRAGVALGELGGVARRHDGGDRRLARQKLLSVLDAAQHLLGVLAADGDAVAAADAARLDDARLAVEDLDGLGGALAHAGVAHAALLADGGDELGVRDYVVVHGLSRAGALSRRGRGAPRPWRGARRPGSVCRSTRRRAS